MSHAIPILMYHQIDASPARGTPLRGLTVTPERFARQMALLRWFGYRGVSMDALTPYLSGEATGKVVGITFDDGYCNNLEHALPVLLRHGFTATCYAVSSPHERRNAWDEHIGVPQKPLFSPADMREWVKAGMDLGCHTRHHADLTQLSDEIAQEEIVGGRHELEDITGQAVRHFCYPYGHYTERDRQMVMDAGYTSATTTQRGCFHAGDDLFALRRVLIAHSNSLFLFGAKTMSAYEDRYR